MTERPFSLFFWPALGALVERGLATQIRGDRGCSEGDFICCTALGTNRRHLASRALYNVRLRVILAQDCCYPPLLPATLTGGGSSCIYPAHYRNQYRASVRC